MRARRAATFYHPRARGVRTKASVERSSGRGTSVPISSLDAPAALRDFTFSPCALICSSRVWQKKAAVRDQVTQTYIRSLMFGSKYKNKRFVQRGTRRVHHGCSSVSHSQRRRPAGAAWPPTSPHRHARPALHGCRAPAAGPGHLPAGLHSDLHASGRPSQCSPPPTWEFWGARSMADKDPACSLRASLLD